MTGFVVFLKKVYVYIYICAHARVCVCVCVLYVLFIISFGKYYGMLDCEKWFRLQLELIPEAKGATFHWDYVILT